MTMEALVVQAQNERLHGRNGAIWRDYIAGHNQEWCAAKYDLSQTRVSAILREVRQVIDADGKSRADWRREALELLLETRAGLVAVIRAELPPAFSGTEVLHATDGTEIKDRSAYFSAVSHLEKLETRMARLMGWDAPVTVEQLGDLRVTVEGVDIERLG